MVENCRPRRGSPAAGRCAAHGAVEFCVATRRGWRPLYIVSVIHLAGANAHQADHFSGGGDRRVNTGSTICRAALTIISWRHGESESRVDQRETGDVFHLIQQIEATGDRKPAEGQEKKRVRSSASQKTGIEKPTSATALIRYRAIYCALRRRSSPPECLSAGQSRRRGCTAHGRRENLAQLLRNQLAVNAGDAEIPVQHPFKPEQPRIPQGSALQWGMRGEIAQAETDKGQKKRVISSSSRRRRVKIIMASSPLRYFPAIRQRTKRYRKG